MAKCFANPAGETVQFQSCVVVHRTTTPGHTVCHRSTLYWSTGVVIKTRNPLQITIHPLGLPDDVFCRNCINLRSPCDELLNQPSSACPHLQSLSKICASSNHPTQRITLTARKEHEGFEQAVVERICF